MLTIQSPTALGWIPPALGCAAHSALSWRVTILTTALHHRIARSQATSGNHHERSLAEVNWPAERPAGVCLGRKTQTG
jgi:hypothetical protein